MSHLTINNHQIIIDVIQDQTVEKNIVLEEKGSLTYLVICQNATANITIQSAHPDTKANIFAICPSKDKQPSNLSMTSKLLHNNTHSDMFILSLAGDHAHINIDGGVYIGPGITKPAGHLTEKNIILGHSTQVNALPLLDVYSNDVQASHGASIDKLNDTNLFYLQSKGLTQQQSSHLMIEGYIDHILNHFTTDQKTNNITDIKQQIIGYIL